MMFLVYLPWLVLASLPIGLLFAFADQLQPLVGTGGGMAMGAFSVIWLAGTAAICLKGLNGDFRHTTSPLVWYVNWTLVLWVFKFWLVAGALLMAGLFLLVGQAPAWVYGAGMLVGAAAGGCVGLVGALIASMTVHGK